VRSTDGLEATLDPTLAYCLSPGQEERYDHPGDAGDDCTTVFLAPDLVEHLRGGDGSLPRGPIPTTPALDLQHRLLLAAARRAFDQHSIVERAVMLAATVLERDDPAPVGSGRASSAPARRAIVDGTRELLATDPDRSLPDLARDLAVSPHHLSRTFREATGHTISRHRVRLRVRALLERLAGGDHELARLAAELGFADQSHLTRSVRAETGTTPGLLRRALE
jgi:AraC-like DNA-binding protein